MENDRGLSKNNRGLPWHGGRIWPELRFDRFLEGEFARSAFQGGFRFDLFKGMLTGFDWSWIGFEGGKPPWKGGGGRTVKFRSGEGVGDGVLEKGSDCFPERRGK